MRVSLALAAVIGLGLVAWTLSATAAESDSDHAKDEHRFVRITLGSLHLTKQKVGTDEAFGWVNYSSKIARVSLDGPVARKMQCKSVTSFRATGERVESSDIRGSQFSALCRLAPGEYAYRVNLRSGAGSSAGPGRTLEGTLIVE